MILTRSPLSPEPKLWFSLDLHVLSAPPAFVLSQDQTLREESDSDTKRSAGKAVQPLFGIASDAVGLKLSSLESLKGHCRSSDGLS